MERLDIKTLLVTDDDLECKLDKLTLTDLSTKHLSFNEDVLKPFELIIYTGRKGTKILRSRYFKSGKIG